MGKVELWERVAPMLEGALDGACSIEQLELEVDEGRAQVWPLPNSAVVTQVAQQPGRRVLRVWLAGGDLHELQRCAHFLDDLALLHECSRIEIDGRRGWKRVLKKHGFTETRITLVKDLDDGSSGLSTDND